MKDEGYNGYENYQTWAVCLWIDNEQSTQQWALDLARECLDSAPEHQMVREGFVTVEQRARYDLADLLQDELSEGAPDIGNNVYSDLMHSAIARVNWDEVAQC